MPKQQKKQNKLESILKQYSRERTLVLIKPEGVERRLIGRIVQRFEDVGFRIVGLGIVWSSKQLMDRHYPKDKAWIERLGSRTTQTAEQFNLDLDLKRDYGVKTVYELGQLVRGWLIDYMCSGPIVKMCLEGPFVVEKVRKMTGSTLPLNAEPGTIRGDFSFDVPVVANLARRAIQNLVHASETKEEAEREIKLWFKKGELLD